MSDKKLKINLDIKKYLYMPVGKIKSLWASIPKPHKDSLFRGFGAYLALLLILFLIISGKADESRSLWESKVLYSATVINAAGDSSNAPDFSESKSAFSSTNKISIIISGMGMDANLTTKVLNELPKEVTLAFSPYSPKVRNLMDESLKKDHENLILIPMESSDYPKEDAGQKALSSKNSIDENEKILEWVLDKDPYALGIMNFMGSFFLNDKIQVGAMLKSLEDKNKFFVEDIVTPESQIPELIKDKNIKYMQVDMKLNTPLNKDDFMKEMDKAENIAKTKGYAVIIISPYPINIDFIKVWEKSAKTRGFSLATLSSVWKNIPNHGQ